MRESTRKTTRRYQIRYSLPMLNTHLDFVLQETELDADYTSLSGNKKGKLKKNNRLTVN